MADTPSKTLVIPSDPNDALVAQHQVMDVVEQAGFNESALFAIRLALDEALNNAISHGNQRDPSKTVTIRFTINEDSICIRVTDEGTGFDPSDVPDPRLPENITRPHGRGIMLMRAYMTEVDYDDNGKTVVLIKQRNCPLPLAQ